MITSVIKKQKSDSYILLNPYMVFQTWNHRKKKKESNSFVSLYC